MNGAHDMGGVMGFGRVVLEPNEPVFHLCWEGRVRAMMSAMALVMRATNLSGALRTGGRLSKRSMS
jgi:hypothetical protein